MKKKSTRAQAVDISSNQDCLNYVNSNANRLYGINKRGETIYGKICEGDNERYWLPIYQLSHNHEFYITKWIAMGGEVVDSK